MPWISAGASLAGGLLGSRSAKKAKAAQDRATDEANALAREQSTQVRDDLAQFRNYGENSANKLASLLGIIPENQVGAFNADRYLDANPELKADAYFATRPEEHYRRHGQAEGRSLGLDPVAASTAAAGYGSLLDNFTGEDVASEPGYQFGMDQGMKGLDRTAAARGGFFSGAALKAGTRFAQDYAGGKFNDAFNRDSAQKAQKYNFLMGVTGVGQNAAAQTGNAGQTMATQVGVNTTANGNAAGASAIAQGNAWQGGIQGAIGSYQNNEMMKLIRRGNSGWGDGNVGSEPYAGYHASIGLR